MSIPTLTIMICTFDRPTMLRDALESVQRQTARAAIARIIVSENSLNEESKNICTEFKELPIVYVQQKPPVVPLLHPTAIWHLIETPLLAILHDDDWWAPGHLESALKALNSNERCAAVYASFFESFKPRGYVWLNQSYYFAWLAAGGDFAPSIVYLDPPSVMLANIINAGLHYSTVVGRTELMWDACSKNVALGNAFDNDRTFAVFLSQHGYIGYVTTPEVYVRQHPFRDAWSEEHLKRGHMQMARETTRYLLKAFPREVALAAAQFKLLAEELDFRETSLIWKVICDGTQEPQWTTLVRECGIELSAMDQHPQDALLPKWFHSLILAISPPILLRWAMTIRNGGLEKQIWRWQKKNHLARNHNDDH